MSGIQVHTSDPISPAKQASTATAIVPQTAYAPTQSTPYQPATTTQAAPNNYPSARPAQALPTPTRTVDHPTNDGPPAPQPGAFPQPIPPATTAKATLPPPPKVGEKPQPASYYTPAPTATPTLPQPYPPQMSYPPLSASSNSGIPLHSATSTSTNHSYQSHARPTTLPLSNDGAATRSSLEHPPGYVQNQYATEMTFEQRSATLRQEQGTGSSSASAEPVLGYVPPNRSRSGSSAAAVTGGDIWEGAKKYLGQVGEKVGQVEGKTWEWINGKH